MLRWIPLTFVRITVFFIGGLLTAIYLPDLWSEQSLLPIVLGSLIVYLGLYVAKPRVRRVFNPGYIALPLVFLLGYCNVLMHTHHRKPDHFERHLDQIQYYKVSLVRFAEERENSWKAEAEIKETKDSVWRARSGKVILYFSKKEFERPFNYGDVLLIAGHPQALQPPFNPGEFDYQRFLSFRNIYHQHFLKNGDVKFLGHRPDNFIVDQAVRARVWSEQIIKTFVTGTQEQGVAAALVLGVTDGLDSEVLRAYAATGAMHVLAVSGLHISIIYGLILLFLKPLQKLRSGKWMIAGVSIICLWAYAFVTGLSPSVLRAVVMFSFVAFARPLARSTNIYNTLAASAFCILVFDPFLIMSVGFQLSYLAVLGIIMLQVPLYNLWMPSSRIMDEIWKITTVSVAAQVATFGLGLLYFHQFPNYFLVSNLFVIPVSFAVLIGGLLLLVVSWWNVLASFVGLLVTWSIKLLNGIVFVVESFPYSLVEDIYINTLQCWCLMFAVAAWVATLLLRQFKYLYAALLFVILFSAIAWHNTASTFFQARIAIYRVPKHTAVDLMERGETVFYADTALSNNPKKIQFHIKPYRLATRTHVVVPGDNSQHERKFEGGRIIEWNGKVVLNLQQRHFTLPEKISCDILLLSNDALISWKSISGITANVIVFDGSNSYYKVGRLLKDQLVPDAVIHSVLHQGAYIAEI